MRKPFQGVINIIRFNWPFYVLSLISISFFIFLSYTVVTMAFQFPLLYAGILVLLPIIISLLISFYVYDLSGLYKMNWLPDKNPGKNLVNINAGFDETSSLIKERFRDSELKVFDFYDPKKHTEASIERARKAYPAHPGTISISSVTIPLENETIDTAYVIFAAHEIRNDGERIRFFKELRRVIKPNGQIIVAEHLRDLPNFMAYTIGFFHFLPISSWHNTFNASDLKITTRKKHTPFVNIFILEKHGNSF